MCILHDILRRQAGSNKTLAVDTKVRQVEYCILAVLQRDKFIFARGY
jgi:hypothetical protein